MATGRMLTEPPDLRQLNASSTIALFLDFDGTLVDIAPAPDAIVVPPGLGEALEQLASRRSGRLALVSGRAVADLRTYLGPIRLACAGSHGAERFAADGTPIGPAPAPLPEPVRDALRTFADQHPGIGFEDKVYGAALHLRARADLADLAIAFVGQVADAARLAVKHGIEVVEVVRPGASKGAAVDAFMELAPFCEAMPIFIGDDLTDEDGFCAAERNGGFGILVGTREETRACYGLERPAQVRDWLGL